MQHPLSCLLSVLLLFLLILAIYAREVTSITTSCSISAAELKALEALYRCVVLLFVPLIFKYVFLFFILFFRINDTARNLLFVTYTLLLVCD